MSLQPYLGIWVILWFVTIMVLSIVFQWKVYHPKWAQYYRDDEQSGLVYINQDKTMLYRMIIMVTSPLSWLYLIAKYVKSKDGLESS